MTQLSDELLVHDTRLETTPTKSEALFDELLEEAEIEIDPIDDSVGQIAIRCFETYIK